MSLPLHISLPEKKILATRIVTIVEGTSAISDSNLFVIMFEITISEVESRYLGLWGISMESFRFQFSSVTYFELKRVKF